MRRRGGPDSGGPGRGRGSGGARPAAGGQRRAAYNAYVQKDRLEKFYAKKRTFSRYRRFRKFEERQKHAQPAACCTQVSFLGRVLGRGEESLEEEYERRLAISFGGTPLATALKDAVFKGTRKVKVAAARRAECSAEETRGVSAAGAAGHAPKLKRRRSHVPSSAPLATENAPAQASAAEGREAETCGEAERRSRRKKRRREVVAEAPEFLAERGAAAATPAASAGAGEDPLKPARPSSREGRRSKVETPGTVPEQRLRKPPLGRFARELCQYQEAQEAKQAARQRWLEEARQRNKRRRDFAKNRAVMGQLLSQRTSRGQPRMQSMLDAFTAKLTRRAGAASARASAGSC